LAKAEVVLHPARHDLTVRIHLGGAGQEGLEVVLHEILHRYVAISRRDAIQPAFDALLGVVDEVFAIELSCVERAKTLVHGRPGLSARDAIHIATMELHGVPRILTFDAGFEGHPGIDRIRA
jgi:hypothetical protein